MNPSENEPLTWRNVSTSNLRDFVGMDGEQDVARIYLDTSGPKEGGVWRWSAYAVVPGRPGITNGAETDPKEARRKVEAAWAYAKAYGTPTRTAVAEHMIVADWSNFRMQS